MKCSILQIHSIFNGYTIRSTDWNTKEDIPIFGLMCLWLQARYHRNDRVCAWIDHSSCLLRIKLGSPEWRRPCLTPKPKLWNDKERRKLLAFTATSPAVTARTVLNCAIALDHPWFPLWRRRIGEESAFQCCRTSPFGVVRWRPSAAAVALFAIENSLLLSNLSIWFSK